ncbi:MAG TPA: NADH-quinone oxidoreductase subunit NuoK [Elusimicrobia bacterium]|nr:NADH-quinone oxidoreductase subunit NuoK [Elusimicrobiota bacterium]
MITVKELLIINSLLFAIGIYGVLTRRNTIGILMSVELIFNSACLNFVVFTRALNPTLLSGEVFVLFIIAVAAAEAAVGLALLFNIYRSFKDIATDRYNLMRG